MKPHRTELNGHCTLTTTWQQYHYLYGSKVVDKVTTTSSTSKTALYQEYVSCGPLIKGDFCAPNPWSYSIEENHLPIGSFSLSDPYNATWQTASGAMNGWFSCPPWGYDTAIESARTRARSMAIKKFYSKMGFSGAGLETDIGEIASTARMLESTAKNLFRPVRAFSTLSRALLSRWGFARIPANAYLAYIFGIRPIAEDIHNVLNVLATQSSTLRPITGSGSARVEFNSTSGGFKIDNEFVVHHKIGALFNIEDQNVFDQTRIGALSPATLAWELLPFSFVADWICGVGDYLTQLQLAARNGCSLSHGYESRLEIFSREGFLTKAETRPGGGSYTASADFFGKKTTFSRSLMSSFPSPMCPSLKVSLGSNQLVTLGALLTQALPATARWFR